LGFCWWGGRRAVVGEGVLVKKPFFQGKKFLSFTVTILSSLAKGGGFERVGGLQGAAEKDFPP